MSISRRSSFNMILILKVLLWSVPISKRLKLQIPDWLPDWLPHLKMRAIKKKLSKQKSCPKSFSSKCSVHFKLMLWLEYLIHTHEIFAQKTGAHVLFESFFRTIFALLEVECHRFLISDLAWYTLYFEMTSSTKNTSLPLVFKRF